MRLGSILKEPEDLESSLNLHAINKIPDQSKRDASLAVRRHVETALSDKNSLLAKAVASVPALSAGVSVDGHWNHDAGTTLDALNVRATVFIPSENYMNEALKNAEVIKYTKGLFGRALYIIVGTATASKLSVKENRSAEQKAAFSTNITPPVTETEFDAKASHEKKAEIKSEWEVGEECDFAYRVRKFVYSKMRGLRKGENYSENALFGSDRNQPPADDDVEEVPVFEWFENEDASVAGVVQIEAPYEGDEEE